MEKENSSSQPPGRGKPIILLKCVAQNGAFFFSTKTLKTPGPPRGGSESGPFLRSKDDGSIFVGEGGEEHQPPHEKAGVFFSEF